MKKAALLALIAVAGCGSPNAPQNAPQPAGYRVDPRAADTSFVIDTAPAWSPDGRTIAYFHRGTAGQPKGIYVLEVDARLVAGEPRLITPVAGSIFSDVDELRFSPDGARVAYRARGNIWTVDIRSSENVQITTRGGNGPDWHPDGRRIAYFRGVELVDDPGGIRTVDTITGEDKPVRRVDGGLVYGGYPRWHPDGRSLVFWFGDPATGNQTLEYFRVFPDSTDYIRLTLNDWQLSAAHWFRAGDELVFRAGHDGGDTTYVMAADGSNQRRFFSPELPVYLGTRFDFSPDYSKAVVVRPDASGRYWTLWILRFDVRGTIVETQLTFAPIAEPTG